MGNLTYALVIIMSINVILFISQVSILQINPTGANFYDCQGSLMSSFDVNKCKDRGNVSLDQSLAQSNLPSGNPSVDATSGNVFTDLFNTIKNWVLEDLGVKYLLDMVSAPAHFLNMMGLPQPISFALSTLWYAVTFFLFVAWIKGGSS